MATHLIFWEPGHPQVHGGDESNALAKGTDEPVSDRNPWQTLKKISCSVGWGAFKNSNDDLFNNLLWNHKRMPFSDSSYIRIYNLSDARAPRHIQSEICMSWVVTQENMRKSWGKRWEKNNEKRTSKRWGAHRIKSEICEGCSTGKDEAAGGNCRPWSNPVDQVTGKRHSKTL